jgi:hypothetical protein
MTYKLLVEYFFSHLKMRTIRLLKVIYLNNLYYNTLRKIIDIEKAYFILITYIIYLLHFFFL